MNNIPTHKISSQFDGMPFFLCHVTEKEHKGAFQIDYAHRDDCYIIVLVEKGMAKLAIDFEDYELSGNSLLCVAPGQVHYIKEFNACGWFLVVDSVLIKEDYKKSLGKYTLRKNKLQLSNDEFSELHTLVSLIHKQIDKRKPAITHDLISAYIGLITEGYKKDFPVSTYNRFASITTQFELALAENYITLKRPSDYAEKLNISVPYLNECVRNTTGFSVSHHIQQRVILESKRMLYHSNKSVKEIAAELGYSDYAYFSRLFSKVAGMAAITFRNKNCD